MELTPSKTIELREALQEQLGLTKLQVLIDNNPHTFDPDNPSKSVVDVVPTVLILNGKRLKVYIAPEDYL